MKYAKNIMHFKINVLEIGTSSLLLFALLPIVATPYRNDDSINKNIHSALAESQTTLFDAWKSLTIQWMQNEGRFFPSAVAYGLLVFYIFTNLVAYKLLLITIHFVTVQLVGHTVSRAISVPHFRYFFVITMAGLLQLQLNWYDALDSFAALPTASILFAFLGINLMLQANQKTKPLAILGAFSWYVALTQYEVIVLWTPLLFWLLMSISKKTTGRLTKFETSLFVIPLFTQITTSLFLRSNLGHGTAPGYTLSLDPHNFSRAYLYQFSAAIPGVQDYFSEDLRITLEKFLITFVIILVIITALIYRNLFTLLTPTKLSDIGTLTCFVLLSLASSPLLVAITARWQSELTAGHGYISIIYQYFGLGILIGILGIIAFRSSNFIRRIYAVSITLLISYNIAINFSIATLYNAKR